MAKSEATQTLFGRSGDARAARVRRRPDGIVEIVAARRAPRARDTAWATVWTMLMVAVLTPLALLMAPVLFLAPLLAVPTLVRSLRRTHEPTAPATRPPLAVVA